MTDMNRLMIARTKLDDALQLLQLAYGMTADAHDRLREPESNPSADDALFLEIAKTEGHLAELIRTYADELDMQIGEENDR
ncbi:hypothetical protein [Bifidobacterium sp. SO1]|uniref:hypothetical protein n=1 Tax=Bifidobacterium sp. SO1 TaxID=2809029 RepID=UPI001BDD41C8|nr:hypothetical protein [Bifidobacterium sp. SO1]MBT1162824.1 hypothetical protein [Bifidobacterium sp. SO1]